jgi:hypothetical protein
MLAGRAHEETNVPSSASMPRRVFAAALLALLPLDASIAADGYYKGKSITFVIGSAPGGGYDTYSRLLAKPSRQNLTAGLPSSRRTCPARQHPRRQLSLQRRAQGRHGDQHARSSDLSLSNPGTPDLKIDAVNFSGLGILRNNAVLFARREAPVQKITDVFNKG